MQERTLALRTCFIGPAPPASPQEGQFWADNTASPYRVLQYLRIDAGPASWQPVGPLSRLPASINADPSIVDDRLAPFEFKARSASRTARRSPRRPR